MTEFQQRVVEERRALDEKLGKLEAFFGTVLFRSLDKAEQDRLHTQCAVMRLYSDILRQRIEAFKR